MLLRGLLNKYPGVAKASVIGYSSFGRCGQRSTTLRADATRWCATQTYWGSEGVVEGGQLTGYQAMIPAMLSRAVRSQWLTLRSVALGGELERAPADISQILVPSIESSSEEISSLFGDESALALSSTLKKRAMKMNKHKLKKRRKALRMNTKRSRG